MIKGFVKQWSLSLQARLGLWLTETFCDVHDVSQYDPHIQTFLSELQAEVETYAPLPGFDYRDTTPEHWKIFVRIAGQWQLMSMPNPFYEGSMFPVSDATVVEPMASSAPDLNIHSWSNPVS